MAGALRTCCNHIVEVARSGAVIDGPFFNTNVEGRGIGTKQPVFPAFCLLADGTPRSDCWALQEHIRRMSQGKEQG